MSDGGDGVNPANEPEAKEISRTRLVLAYSSMVLAAFVGGFITANVGSGSDIVLYAYGLLGWNLLVEERRASSGVQPAPRDA